MGCGEVALCLLPTRLTSQVNSYLGKYSNKSAVHGLANLSGSPYAIKLIDTTNITRIIFGIVTRLLIGPAPVHIT